MQRTYPGTTIEVARLVKGCSASLFDGVFAAGGLTLSQVSVMTGLEPYMIQNWVKRGFVSSPVKRMYSRDQFARIIIINMLRDSLQIEKICSLIRIISGDPKDRSDDLISDSELYHRYVDMLSEGEINVTASDSVHDAAVRASEGFEERLPNAKKQLVRILQIMLLAHTASRLKEKSCELLSTLQ